MNNPYVPIAHEKPWLGATDNVLAYIIKNPGVTNRQIMLAFDITRPAAKNCTWRLNQDVLIIGESKPDIYSGQIALHWRVNPAWETEIIEGFSKMEREYKKRLKSDAPAP